MKLIYATPIRFPTERAHGAQIAHMCHAFGQNGVEVELVVPRYKNPVSEDLFTYYNITKNFKVTYLQTLPWGVGTKIGFLTNLIFFTIKVVLYVLKSKYDLVYSRHEFVLFGVALVVPNRKMFWESHEARFNFWARSLLKKGVKCIAISEGIRDFYLEKGVPKEQILVAHDGIDESFFGPVETKEEARTRLGILSDKPVAMYIGGLDKWKGVETFLEASKCNSETLFVVIGGREEEVVQYAKEYPTVLFLGQRPYHELKDNQQAADILVCTGTKENELSEKYTSPLKLFSYMTSKIPIVAADLQSIRNVVSENEVLLYNPESVVSLNRSLGQILDDEKAMQIRFNHAHGLSKKYLWNARAESIHDFLIEG